MIHVRCNRGVIRIVCAIQSLRVVRLRLQERASRFRMLLAQTIALTVLIPAQNRARHAGRHAKVSQFSMVYCDD